MIVNLSGSGLAIAGRRAPLPGEHLQMQFEMGPTGRVGEALPVEAVCEVIWVRGENGRHAAFGCRFIDLPQAARQVL